MGIIFNSFQPKNQYISKIEISCNPEIKRDLGINNEHDNMPVITVKNKEGNVLGVVNNDRYKTTAEAAEYLVNNALGQNINEFA